MSAQSHGAQPKKSDLPWLVGATLVFGPLFLYLVSPSARKSQHAHAVHNDHHDFPALEKEKHESKQPEIMKDDEGTPADVTDSIALSEESDVPKDSQSPETVATTLAAAEEAPVGEAAKENEGVSAGEAATTDEPAKEPEAPAAPEATENTSEPTPAEPAKTEAPAASSDAEKTQA